VHGAFAGSAFFLIVAMFPLAALVKKAPRILWIFYGIAVLTFLYALGKENLVHPFMVKHLPLFGAFRVPGRIVIWIPLTILPLFAWMLRRENRSALFAAATGALVLFAMNWLWTTNTLPTSSISRPHKIIGRNYPSLMDSLILTLSLVTALLLAGAARYRRAFRPLLVLSGGFMILTTWLCVFNGTWRQKVSRDAHLRAGRASRKASVSAHSDPGYGMEMRTVTEYKSHKLKPERQLGTIAHRVERLDFRNRGAQADDRKGGTAPSPALHRSRRRPALARRNRRFTTT